MSEHMNMRNARRYRRQLLTTVSAIALTAAIYGSGDVRAADADRPLVWIEGGWHFEDVQGAADPFVPPLDGLVKQGGYTPTSSLQNVLGYGYGGEGSISFQPEDSNWIFSASIRYGRSHGLRNVHQEKEIVGSPLLLYSKYHGSLLVTPTTTHKGYNVATAGNNESHVIVDFLVGKDVGLGLFGHDASSTISLGARYAQMKLDSGVEAHSRPDTHFGRVPVNLVGTKKYYGRQFYHQSGFTGDRDSSFSGLGPSLSWSNSVPLAGTAADGELALDWGVNAALLFGRQKVKTQHESHTRYHFIGKSYIFPSNHSKYKPQYLTSYTHHSANRTHTRSVTVPNIGGFAGISYCFVDAKLSVGYRADYFFGAMDGGIDARHDINRGFFGPFASVSVGIGD